MRSSLFVNMSKLRMDLSTWSVSRYSRHEMLAGLVTSLGLQRRKGRLADLAVEIIISSPSGGFCRRSAARGTFALVLELNSLVIALALHSFTLGVDELVELFRKKILSIAFEAEGISSIAIAITDGLLSFEE